MLFRFFYCHPHLLGTCFLCVVIIVILHWKERRKDRQEKLAEANRFHFDAM